MTAVWALQLPHTEKLVLLALADNANDEGDCWPSITTIAEKCCMHRTTVIRSITDLENRGLVVRSSDAGRTNSYRLHPSQPATSSAERLVAQSDHPSSAQRRVPVAERYPTRSGALPRTVIEPSVEPSVNRHSRNAREREIVPRETPTQPRTESTWEAHRQWFLDELRSVYPSNLHTDADWELAARPMAGKLESGETTRADLHRLTLEFAAQQDAKGNRNTQWIENPVRHFDGRGKWRGPFALPSAQAGPRRETAMDRIYAATGGSALRVIDHD